jgi:hypothetical protein
LPFIGWAHRVQSASDDEHALGTMQDPFLVEMAPPYSSVPRMPESGRLAESTLDYYFLHPHPKIQGSCRNFSPQIFRWYIITNSVGNQTIAIVFEKCASTRNNTRLLARSSVLAPPKVHHGTYGFRPP